MKTLFGIVLVIASLTIDAQQFPGSKWERIENIADFGFSESKLDSLSEFISSNLSTTSFLVIQAGKILFEFGPIEDKYYVRSARKSFMSALYGFFIEDGYIDPDQTLGELNIIDFSPLNDFEKEATIRQCLQARSGIYLPAEAESGAMLAVKPKRGSYQPGEYWCYNNWDFNVLATILQSQTGKGFFTQLKNKIADPIGMESFEIEDGTYYQYRKSIHPAYHFKISALDMARFGYLMLNKGRWENEQLLPAYWIDTITSPLSDATAWGSDGYGYMWWVKGKGKKYPHFDACLLPDGSYSARGAYGQFLIIIPEYDMVVVHQVINDENPKAVSSHAVGYVLNKLFEAGGFPFIKHPSVSELDMAQILGTYQIREGVTINITEEQQQLFVERKGASKEIILPLSDKSFITLGNAIKFKYEADQDKQLELHLIQMDFDRTLKKIQDH